MGMSELPAQWSEVPIGSFARVVGGGTPPSKDPANFAPPGQGIPWLTPADLSGYRRQTVERGARDLTPAGFAACGATLLPKGSVLFSSRAPIGYVAIAANEISTNQGFKSFVLPEGFDSRFCYYQLKHLKPEAEAIATGTTFKELSGAAAATLPFKVAPLKEQARIADHLDTLLARIKACNDHLDAIPGLLKRFRQAVLNAATTGALTEDWRAADAQPWRPVLLGDVASNFSYGSAAKSSKAGAVPVLRMGNIQKGELDWTDLVYTSDPKEIEKYQLVPGDVLFNRTNSPELVGKTAVFQGERPAVYAGYLIRVRCSSSLLPDFLNYCLGSKAGRDYCWSVKSDGVSQSNINAKKLAAFPLALPQPDEQEEIIRRVKALFALSTGVEMRYRRMLERAERLTPQVLAKAFRGELVPQDPNDEPASVLLAKLKTGPTSAAATPARKRSKATGERPKMSNVDQNSVKTMILKLDTDRFSFDELRAHAAGDYESLKTALFALLEEPNPVVRQVFDEDVKAMRLVRVKP
jgi:type I restriction enzyme S subunit